MKDTEIVEKIEEFSEFLSIGTAISDMVRWLGWVFVKGLAFIIDGLESVTDEVLLVKQFFQNPEIATFVDTIRPFLYILLAFSLLYTGYLLIFQKKFDREGMVMNLFIALAIVVALSQGMGKANEFTDDAINAINTTELYDEGEGSLSDNIISRQLTDLLEFDKKGWETADLDPSNTLPLSMISHLSVTEKMNVDRKELELTPEGKDIISHKLTWSISEKELVELENSTLMPWTNESYYRYDINWLTLLTTLTVMAFTLFSIAYKLARLSFELTFNYILALLVAPADIHDGQKTKKIMQSILNTFLVIILIFLSMKIYMIGTAYVATELDGLAYLIALIAFSVAVIDGPNIVERLFGIDAGLKNGWGVLAGAYAGSKLISGASGAVMNTMNRFSGSDGTEKDNDQGEKLNGRQNKNGVAAENAMSPNDGEGKETAQTGLAGGGIAAGSAITNTGKKGNQAGTDEHKGSEKTSQTPSPNEDIELSKENTKESPESSGISGNGDAAPESANSDKATLSGNQKESQEPSQGAGALGGHLPLPNDLEGNDSSAFGVHARTVSSNGSAPSPNDADRTSGGTAAGNIQNERMEQRTLGHRNDEAESIHKQAGGNSGVRGSSAGNSGPPAAASPNTDITTSPSSAATQNQNGTAPSGGQQSTTSVNHSGGDQAIDEEIIMNETQGTTTLGASNVSTNTSGASNANAAASSNTGNTAAPSSAGGQSRNETGNGPSGRQQNTTTITHSGGDQTIDENVRVNETQGTTTQGTRNVTSNTSAASGADGFTSEAPATPGLPSTSSSGSSRTINQDSASRETIVNEATVNRNHLQDTQQTDQTNVNDIRRSRTHHLNPKGSNTLDRIKNYRRGR